MSFVGFIRVGHKSRSRGLDELFLDNLLVNASNLTSSSVFNLEH